MKTFLLILLIFLLPISVSQAEDNANQDNTLNNSESLCSDHIIQKALKVKPISYIFNNKSLHHFVVTNITYSNNKVKSGEFSKKERVSNYQLTMDVIKRKVNELDPGFYKDCKTAFSNPMIQCQALSSKEKLYSSCMDAKLNKRAIEDLNLRIFSKTTQYPKQARAY